MRRSDAFPSNYLSKDDVQAGPLRATIADVRIETIQSDHGGDEKPVMSFKEAGTKTLILNNTNWGVIEEAFGVDSDAWGGKTIELYLDPGVMFAGRKVGGVRVRIPNGKPNAAAPTAAPVPAAAAPAPKPLSWEDALSMATEAGMSETALKDALKATGIKKGYSPTKDSDVMRKILREATAVNDTIPFDSGPGQPGTTEPVFTPALGRRRPADWDRE